MKNLYKKILKPILFLFDPELIHNVFIWIGEVLSKVPGGRCITGLIYQYKGIDVLKTVDGIKYKYPIILAAGFDYNARLIGILDKMSFGGEELGSITLRPCSGNEKPRLKRAIKSQSIIVYKGLRNDGVDKIIKRIKSTKIPKDYVVGVSIARTNDPNSVDLESGIADFCGSLRKLVDNNIGNYYTVNISCPNAFGGEGFATKQNLEKLLKEISKIKHSKPIYVKMPINLEWKEFKDLCDIVVKYKFSGVVIGNLNKKYEDIDYREEAPEEYRGGLSGKPCRMLSTQLIKRTRQEYGKKLTIIGCGGILSTKDAIEKFEAGADLVQLITGMIFEGPHLMKEICEELANKRVESRE